MIEINASLIPEEISLFDSIITQVYFQVMLRMANLDSERGEELNKIVDVAIERESNVFIARGKEVTDFPLCLCGLRKRLDGHVCLSTPHNEVLPRINTCRLRPNPRL